MIGLQQYSYTRAASGARAYHKVLALSKREQAHMYTVTVEDSRSDDGVSGAEAEADTSAIPPPFLLYSR